MLVAIDSPLRKLSAQRDRKQTLYFDGVRYAAEMSNLAFTRLLKTLNLFPTLTAGSVELTESITSSVMDSWTVIDSVHRLRELLRQFPGMKQKAQEILIFYQTTEGVARFRNGIQHLNNDINVLAEKGLPVWGSLTWRLQSNLATGEETSCGICAGTFFGGATVFMSEFGKEVKEPIGMVCLNIGNASLNLGSLVESTKPIILFLERLVANESEPKNGSDVLLRLTHRPQRKYRPNHDY